MSTATEIRNKFLKGISMVVKPIEGITEEYLNSRTLLPIATLDIAYGMWQERVGKLPMKNEIKRQYNRIQKMWSTLIFSTQGVFYKALDTDDVYYLSELADKIYDKISNDIDLLQLSLQRKMMDVPIEDRKIICDILATETIVLIVHASVEFDWGCRFKTFSNMEKQMHNMADLYLQRNLGKKYRDIRFTDEDDFVQFIKRINKKIYEIEV